MQCGSNTMSTKGISNPPVRSAFQEQQYHYKLPGSSRRVPFKKDKPITIAYASRVDKKVYPCPRFFKPKARGGRESHDGEDVDQHLTESILPLSNVMSFTFRCWGRLGSYNHKTVAGTRLRYKLLAIDFTRYSTRAMTTPMLTLPLPLCKLPRNLLVFFWFFFQARPTIESHHGYIKL